jgi:hypothetical protein
MMCEDYPCCGHTDFDPCDPSGVGYAAYYNQMNHPDYDPYYDLGDN